eukprot:4972861-Prymnesium_polylepis.1
MAEHDLRATRRRELQRVEALAVESVLVRAPLVHEHVKHLNLAAGDGTVQGQVARDRARARKRLEDHLGMRLNERPQCAQLAEHGAKTEHGTAKICKQCIDAGVSPRPRRRRGRGWARIRARRGEIAWGWRVASGTCGFGIKRPAHSTAVLGESKTPRTFV